MKISLLVLGLLLCASSGKHQYRKVCGESVICITEKGALVNPAWTVQRVMIDQENHTIIGYQECKPSEDILVYLREGKHARAQKLLDF